VPNIPATPTRPTRFCDLLNEELARRAPMTLVDLSGLLAERLSGPAPKKAAICKWRKGRSIPAEHHALALCEVFDWDYASVGRLLAADRAERRPRGGLGTPHRPRSVQVG
jgi:hypothetical protein